MMDGAEIVSLADRGRPHAGEAAFNAIMRMIVESDSPAIAGIYVASGICAWLSVHLGIAPEDVLEMMSSAIAEERARRG